MEIRTIKKYFMRCETTSGSLAIEKHLYNIQSNEIESIQWLYDYCELCGINLED